MANVKVRHFVELKGANGRRFYWQPASKLRNAGWRAERLPDDILQAIARAEELNAQLDAWRRGETTQGDTAGIGVQAGTVAHLIRLYKEDIRYKKKADSTKRGYDWALRQIEDWAGDSPVRSLSAKTIQKYYQGLHEAVPGSANHIIRVLRLLMQHGVRESMITSNPAAKPGLIQAKTKSYVWPEEALDLLVEVADKMGRHSIGTAIEIAFWLGQREGDILSLTRAQYRNGSFNITQSKTGARVNVPHSPRLARRLEEELQRQAVRHVTATTLIVSEETGRPYQGGNFSHLFAKVRARAMEVWPEFEAPDGTIVETAELLYMRLRHTAVTRLAEAGCTTAEISSISGHTLKSVENILERYLVRTTKMARSAVEKRLADEKN